MCEDGDLRAFTERFDYLRLVLNAPQSPVDELLVNNLQRAAEACPPERRHKFLVEAGRELARLLNDDLIRLDTILRRIRPV